MRIRHYVEGEETLLWDIYYHTIHNINIKDYSESQIFAWAPIDLDQEIWIGKIKAINPFVVEYEDEILGYADLQSDGLIDHFYCSHRWQRKGVGSMLMERIHQEAKAEGIATLISEVSITAKPFYMSHGFSVIEEQYLEIRGQKLSNYKMQKVLR